MSSVEPESADILRVVLTEDWGVLVEVSFLLIALVLILALVVWVFRRRRKHFEIVELNIPLGGIGTAKLKPNYTDVQIAHKIWTELVTRKAAVPIDPDNDVIVEIYDSWYALFQRVRELISEIPAELLRKEKSTQTLVDIATRSLNEGLRPHLTTWQARFRNWYVHQEDQLKSASPQEVQRDFPDYEELTQDMRRVNGELVRYAQELKKLADGKK